ncbi:MAG: SMP-30/gluconolactonase/LRE family protein [Thalassotalea sp.]
MKKIIIAGAIMTLSACSQFMAPKELVAIPDAKLTVGHVEIYDDAALAFIDTNTKVSIRGEGYTWTEGPVWVDDGGYLLFSDIPNNIIAKYHPQQGTSLYLEKSGATGLVAGDYTQGSNGLLLNPAGELILLQQGDRRIAKMNTSLSTPKADFTTLIAQYDGKRLNSPNDGVYHQNASLYFTDPPYGLKNNLTDERKALDFQGVYQLTAQGELYLLDDKIKFPNGIGLSPDGKTLYVAASDPEQPHWYAYDVTGVGKVNNKRIFYDASAAIKNKKHTGLPDGMAVHSSGVIFASGPEGVWLFSPAGKVLAKVFTGQLSSNCTLSGDEKNLFITADDYLLSFPLK